MSDHAPADHGGKVAVVTGGGRGIGRAIGTALAADGFRVVLAARTSSQVREAAAEIREAGGWATPVTLDVTSWPDVATVFGDVERNTGPIDLLVNNAGANGVNRPLVLSDPAAWWATIESHVAGTYNCMRAALPGMLERGSGRIVNIASLVGTLASPFESDYAAAKAAVIRMTDSVGAELYDTDVKVWAISPGLVKTAMTMDTLADEGAKEWLSDYFEVADEDYTPASRAGELVCRLASGDADALTGRFIHVKDNLDRLIESSDDIIERDDHVLRLRPDRQHLARDTDE